MKKIVFRLSLVLMVAAAAWGVYRLFQQLPQRQQQMATTRVRQGGVVIRSFARGELRAVRSAMLIAPNLFGTVQITSLAPLGAFAKDKDLIVEFDESEVRSRLEEKQLELDQIDEQVKKAQADLQIRNNQDQVELLRTKYSVRRAELEVKRAELKSAIDVKKDQLTLEETRRRLQQLESDIKSRLEQAQAELAVLRERKNRSLLEFQRERQRLMQIKLLAPMSGLVAIRQSRPMGGFFPGMQLPDYREGDQVYPGTPIADVLDLSELEVAAKVGELDRANLREEQEAILRLDAVPEKVFHGKIKSMSGTASANVWSMDPAKKFDVVFAVDMKELLEGLGAKPGQIKEILATAERNRNKAPLSAMSSSMFAGGMAGMMGGTGGGAPGGGQMTMVAGPGGPDQMAAQGSGGVPGEGRGGGGAGEQGQRRGMRMGGGQMSEEDQKKLRALMEKELGGRQMQDLSQEDRQKIFAKIREAMGGASPGRSGGGRQGGEGAASAGAPRAGREPAAGAGPEQAGAGGEARARGEGRGGAGQLGLQRPGGEAGAQAGAQAGEGRQRGERRGEAGGPGGPGGGLPFGFGMGGAQQFTEKDLENAKLPPPPEEESQLEVLLRPGLLADVEIIVENIPNAIHVPVQAVFERDGKPVVYVRRADGSFEPRFIKPFKRSESIMVIAEGVKPGETVALADPTARPGQKKGDEKGAGASKGGAMPVGGGPGGGGR
ncbi:MAG: efflux RND transporter periplasmic adaptor subunit [Acidobacteriota bacterium]